MNAPYNEAVIKKRLRKLLTSFFHNTELIIVQLSSLFKWPPTAGEAICYIPNSFYFLYMIPAKSPILLLCYTEHAEMRTPESDFSRCAEHRKELTCPDLPLIIYSV